MNINEDKKVVEDGRQNILEDETGLEVTASLRDQIANDLIDKLEERDMAQKIANVWTQANSDRVEALDRQQRFLLQYDEFVDPIYQSSTDWGSTLHMPTILTVAKTFHARMFSALTSINPMFTVRARQGANVERAKLIEALMSYTVTDWANDNQGIKSVLDQWIWDWVVEGTGILKVRWDKKFTRFVEVDEVEFPTSTFDVNSETGQTVQVIGTRTEEKAVQKTIKTFEGPMIEHVDKEDLVIVGGNGDPQTADFVIQQEMMTASELWSLADQKIFRNEAVTKIIESGEDSETTEVNGGIKQDRKENAGLAQVDKPFDLQRYRVLEAYLEADVDGSGINSQIVVWLHAETREILRATYLYRIMPTGLRPYFKIDFHQRKNSEWGVGMVELLYSVAKEIDAIHNMRIDVGLITSLPWGFYRPLNSAPEEKLAIEPGSLIPVENPTTDISFPNLGNRVSFGFQEEQALMNQVERLTSISDISLGIVSGQQGAARTATGARTLVGEASANLDIFLQRMNRGWKKMLIYLFHTLQQRLPNDFQFRILGDDGNDYWARVETRQELQGMFDFDIEANSANSNRQVQIEQGDLIFQLTQNPLLLQLGIVNQLNLYNAAKNALQSRGIKEITKYLTKPQNVVRVFTPMEIADRLLQGIDVPLDPTQDLQGFITFVQEILDDKPIDTPEGPLPALLGQFSTQDIALLIAKMREAQQLQQALSAAAAQQANQQQQQINTQAGTSGQSFEQQQPLQATGVGEQGA